MKETHDVMAELAPFVVSTNTRVMSEMFAKYPDMAGKVHHIDGTAHPSEKARKRLVKQAINSHYGTLNPLKYLLHFNQHDMDFKTLKTNVPNYYLCTSFPIDTTDRAFLIYSPDIQAIVSENHSLGWFENSSSLTINEKSDYKGLKNIHVNVEYSLMHEFGHALFRSQGHVLNDHEHEIAADVFAVIHHIQKYGVETEMVQELIDKRRVKCLLGDINHFSADALADVAENLDKYISEAVTSQDIVDIAVNMAQKHGRSKSDLTSMNSAFRALDNKFLSTHPKEVVEELGKVFNTASAPTVKKQAKSLLDIVARRGIKKPDNLAKARPW